MAFYKKSRTYRAFDSENGCFFDKTYEFSYEINEKYDKKIKKCESTFGTKYTIILGFSILLSVVLALLFAYRINISTNIMCLIVCIPTIFSFPVFPIIEYCRRDVLYDKYERPLEDKFETMYNKICVEERDKAKLWLKQHEDEPMTARIQQVVNELNRG